jgi:hypothetical protein
MWGLEKGRVDQQLDQTCWKRRQEEETYPTTNNKKKDNWIGHILRTNYLLKHVTEGKIEGRV